MILFLFDMMFCVVMLDSAGPCGDADPRHRLGPPAKEILSLPGSPARTVISNMLLQKAVHSAQCGPAVPRLQPVPLGKLRPSSGIGGLDSKTVGLPRPSRPHAGIGLEDLAHDLRRRGSAAIAAHYGL